MHLIKSNMFVSMKLFNSPYSNTGFAESIRTFSQCMINICPLHSLAFSLKFSLINASFGAGRPRRGQCLRLNAPVYLN